VIAYFITIDIIQQSNGTEWQHGGVSPIGRATHPN